MKLYNQVRKYGRKCGRQAAVIGASLFGLASQAQAAVPAEVTTAIADMRSDGVTVATGFLVAAIVVAAFLFMRRGAR